MGNTLHSDDGIGSILSARLKGKVPHIVYDSGTSPENYLGKIIKDKPETVLIIDAADFGAQAGEFRILESEEIVTTNLFSTHNASINLTIDYLQNNLKLDIIILIIQPKNTAFGDTLSPEVGTALDKLEQWFLGLYHPQNNNNRISVI